MGTKDQNTEDDLIILSDDNNDTETFSDDLLKTDEISEGETIIDFDSKADDTIEDSVLEGHEMVLEDAVEEVKEEENIDFGDLSITSDEDTAEEVKKEETTDNFSFGGSALGGIETMESILEDTITKLNSRKTIIDGDMKKEKDHIKELQNKVKEIEKEIAETEKNVSKLDAEGKKIAQNVADLEKMKKEATTSSK